ncbi:hypothetical protein [Ensifer canadensis]|uniref:hypothetical protein n=2 Tax=Ensifer TaxID=106591 RepID=UPI002107AAF7|nr:hypothetical protein [Ensifer canadensis]
MTSNLSKRNWLRQRASSIHELQILSHFLHETMLSTAALREVGRYRTSLNANASACSCWEQVGFPSR